MPPLLVAASFPPVLTSPRLVQLWIMPSLRPAMPPLLVFPVTEARLVQLRTTPELPLTPTSAPTSSSPVTSPVTVTCSTVPWFSPARMPTCDWEPPGATTPSRVRFFTTAPSPSVRNRPTLEPLSSQAKPEMVCPAPSKVPRNTGMVEKPVPAREMSAASTTVTP